MKKRLFSFMLTAILFTGMLPISAYAAYASENVPVHPDTEAKFTTICYEPEKVTASPSSVKFLVNGKNVSVDAYAIGGYNFIKLRDLAAMVNNTNKNFDVIWNGSNKSINLVSNKAYTFVGGEMTKGDGIAKQATRTSSKIFLDGKEVSLTAYTIGQNNYFKLRDVMQLFDIGVGWDGATSTAIINTNESYENSSDIVMSTPTKIVYNVGDSFEIAGFKMVYVGTDGKTTDITKDIELKIEDATIYDGYKFTKSGYFIVYCYYKGEVINQFTINVVEQYGNALESGNYYMMINGKYFNPEGKYAWIELSEKKPEKPFTVKLLMVDENRGPLHTVMYGDKYLMPSGSGQGAHLRTSISSGQYLWCIEKYGDFCTVREFNFQDLIVNAPDNGTEIIVSSYPDTIPENAKITFVKAN
ncbi:MAG: hypothetical protein GX957_13590 [Clostridiaceae bacterium]|nr:hypothetical protein [Clostridiaceae bacterium]